MSPRRAAVLCLTLAAQGLPTRGQLGEEWAAVAAHMQRLAKLPEGTGGLLSLAAAAWPRASRSGRRLCVRKSSPCAP